MPIYNIIKHTHPGGLKTGIYIRVITFFLSCTSNRVFIGFTAHVVRQ